MDIQAYLASVIQGEARTVEGQFAVASTIFNRIQAGNFPGGSSPLGVVQAPNQFTGFNSNYSNSAYTFAGAIMNGTLPSYGSTGNVTEYRAYSNNTPGEVTGPNGENVFRPSPQTGAPVDLPNYNPGADQGGYSPPIPGSGSPLSALDSGGNDTGGVGINGTAYDANGNYVGYQSDANVPNASGQSYGDFTNSSTPDAAPVQSDGSASSVSIPSTPASEVGPYSLQQTQAAGVDFNIPGQSGSTLAPASSDTMPSPEATSASITSMPDTGGFSNPSQSYALPDSAGGAASASFGNTDTSSFQSSTSAVEAAPSNATVLPTVEVVSEQQALDAGAVNNLPSSTDATSPAATVPDSASISQMTPDQAANMGMNLDGTSQFSSGADNGPSSLAVASGSTSAGSSSLGSIPSMLGGANGAGLGQITGALGGGATGANSFGTPSSPATGSGGSDSGGSAGGGANGPFVGPAGTMAVEDLSKSTSKAGTTVAKGATDAAKKVSDSLTSNTKTITQATTADTKSVTSTATGLTQYLGNLAYDLLPRGVAGIAAVLVIGAGIWMIGKE